MAKLYSNRKRVIGRFLKLKTVRLSAVTTVLILTSLLTLPSAVLQGHGVLTGVVCIASSDSMGCPQAAPVLSGASGTTFSLAVNIQGSDHFNCFDVTVTSNAGVLNPMSVDLSNTIIPASVLFVVTRSIQTVGSVAYVEVAACGLGFQTTAPTTGTLFGINYQVAGVVPDSTPVNVQNAQVVNPSNLPETVQNASFTVQGPQPDFMITSLAPTLNFPRGNSTSTTIQLASVNGFSGNVSISVTSSDPGISASIDVPSVSLFPQTIASVPLAVNGTLSTPPGDYLVTVAATNGTLAHSIDLVVEVTDVGFSSFYPPILRITIHTSPTTSPSRGIPTFSAKLEMLVESILGFAGTVLIRASVSPTVVRGPVLVLSASSISLTELAVNVFLNVIAANSTPTGTYTLTITASSGLLVHSITVPLIISRSA